MSKENEIQLLLFAEESMRVGKLAHAKEVLKKIIYHNSFQPRANELLAYLAGNEGDLDGAIDLLRKAVRVPNPSNQALYELGSLCFQKGLLEEAVNCFKQSISLSNNSFDVYHDLALALGMLGKSTEAVDLMLKALTINSNSAEACYNLGRLYDDLKMYAKSLDAYEYALSLNSNFIQAHINKGIALYELNHPDLALQSYREALKIDPKSLDALLNQGMAFQALNRYEEALDSYNLAIAINDQFVDAKWNKSLAQLSVGNFKEGWKNYEYRFDAVKTNPRRFENIPVLSSLNQLRGSRVLVWCEQGFGDTLQFCRYIPLMKELGGDIVFLVQKPLEELMNSLGSCAVIVDELLMGKVSYQVPIMSLPKLFSTDAFNIPAQVPYLRVGKKSLNPHWESNKKFKIGVACSGNPSHLNDARRSMPLEIILPLLDLGEIHLIQKRLNSIDKAIANAHSNIIYYGDEIKNFQDSASLVVNMDAIVTVDTSLAHLSGALNQRTFVCLPYSAEWRWQVERSDSPWYPSAMIFRQPNLGDWKAVIQKVYVALQELVNTNKR